MNPSGCNSYSSLSHFLHLNATNILRLMASTQSFLELLHKSYRLEFYDPVFHFYYYSSPGYKQLEEKNSILFTSACPMTKQKVWQALVHQTLCINVNAYPEYSSYLTLWAVEAGPASWFIPTSKNILLETLVLSFVLLLDVSNFYKEITLETIK